MIQKYINSTLQDIGIGHNALSSIPVPLEFQKLTSDIIKFTKIV